VTGRRLHTTHTVYYKRAYLMPSFGSNRSPSLKKMDYNNGGYGSRRGKFAMSNIFGDPFSLATIGIAIVSTSRS
jgi:hypothetical protein